MADNYGAGAAIATPIQGIADGARNDMETPSHSTRPAKNWTALESIQQHIVDSANYVGLAHANYAKSYFSCNSRYDSPLEVIFHIWWDALSRASEIHEWVYWESQVEVEAGGHKYRLDFQIVPEYQLHLKAKRYGVPIAKMAVELDGHDYHERTKEQVIYRNQRDRDLAAAGWTVLHFSGSELYRDPARCVREAYAHGFKAFGWEWEREVIAAELAAVNEERELTTQES